MESSPFLKPSELSPEQWEKINSHSSIQLDDLIRKEKEEKEEKEQDYTDLDNIPEFNNDKSALKLIKEQNEEIKPFNVNELNRILKMSEKKNFEQVSLYIKSIIEKNKTK